jgi:hypothetical protein
LITPPKAGSGGGNWLPLRVVVALAEPNVPVISTAWEIGAANIVAAASIPHKSLFISVVMNSTFVGCQLCLDSEFAGRLLGDGPRVSQPKRWYGAPYCGELCM